MQKILVILIFFGIFCISCGTIQAQKEPYRPIASIPNASVIDTIEMQLYLNNSPSDVDSLNDIFYKHLLESAREKYGDMVDVADVKYTHTNTIQNRTNTIEVFDLSGKVFHGGS